MSNTNRSHNFFLVVLKGLQSVFFSFVYISWSQLKTCKSWKEIRKEFVDSEFKIGGWHVMNRVQHDDIWNSEFTNISIKKFATLDPTTQNTNRFLSRMITFLAILSTLRDRKEEKKFCSMTRIPLDNRASLHSCTSRSFRLLGWGCCCSTYSYTLIQ